MAQLSKSEASKAPKEEDDSDKRQLDELLLFPCVTAEDYKRQRREDREKQRAKEKPKELQCLSDFSRPGLHRLVDVKRDRDSGAHSASSSAVHRGQSSSRQGHCRSTTKPRYTPLSSDLPTLRELERRYSEFESEAKRHGVSLGRVVEKSEFKSSYNLKACINAARRLVTGDFDAPTASTVEPAFARPRADDAKTNVRQSASVDTNRLERRRPSHDSSGQRQLPAPVSLPSSRVAGTPADKSALNSLSAKLLKAEMLGDNDRCMQLRKEIEEVKRGGASAPAEPAKKNLIIRSGARTGTAMPVRSTSHRPEKMTAVELLAFERTRSVDDSMLDFAAAQTSKTDEYDDTQEAARKKGKLEGTLDMRDVRERDKAVSEHRSLESALDRCRVCIDNKRMPKDLIVELGENIMLYLPEGRSLVNNHCLLSPTHHVTASVLLDENVYDELRSMKRRLTRAFATAKFDAIFLESHINIRNHDHLVIDCIPVEDSAAEAIPFAFRSAITDLEGDWAQNVKLIDLRKRGGLRRSVPKELPYFAVEFGADGSGYAHVIEKEDEFQRYFGKEVIAGVLDIEPRFYRRSIYESHVDRAHKLAEFKNFFS